VHVDVGSTAFSSLEAAAWVGKMRSGLEAGVRHERLPLRAMRADASAVELAGGEVGHLVAEDFLEKSVGGAFEMRREADEAAVGIAAAEAPREARAPLDATLGVELRYRPEAEPVVEGFGQMRGEGRIGRHGGKG
jgi:hypothetical protein